MRITATTCSRGLQILLVSMVLVLAGTRAEAQVSPLWDHYKVYKQVSPFIQLPPYPVTLEDQFGTSTHQLISLEWFANPTVKRLVDPPNTESPINDPLLHYAWWRISPQPFGCIVAATNQFGDQTLHVYEPSFLWTPALKNPPAGISLPQRNHYKCYACAGQPITRPVQLSDQFDVWNTTVLYPRFFCNPAAKTPPTGTRDPVTDPLQHYICYDFQPTDPGTFTAAMKDQFLADYSLTLSPAMFLCVPTYKTGVVAARQDTWGRLKMLYR